MVLDCPAMRKTLVAARPIGGRAKGMIWRDKAVKRKRANLLPNKVGQYRPLLHTFQNSKLLILLDGDEGIRTLDL